MEKPEKKRFSGPELFKKMTDVADDVVLWKEKITQESMAAEIGCGRHWFRRHEERYDQETGDPDVKGLTPSEFLELLEERRRSNTGNWTATEIALQNAHMVNVQKDASIKGLEEEAAALRRQLHLVAMNCQRLGVSESELFKKPTL
ncbi:MAG: hypothetical protein IH613_13250 [Desulfuromonadales bacterium]|nr:hypothetical protein [Desulfuromonadales bacterium]